MNIESPGLWTGSGVFNNLVRNTSIVFLFHNTLLAAGMKSFKQSSGFGWRSHGYHPPNPNEGVHSFRFDCFNDTYDLFQALCCRTSRLKHMLFLRQIRYFRTLSFFIGYTFSLLRVVFRLDVACEPKCTDHCGAAFLPLWRLQWYLRSFSSPVMPDISIKAHAFSSPSPLFPHFVVFLSVILSLCWGSSSVSM